MAVTADRAAALQGLRAWSRKDRSVSAITKVLKQVYGDVKGAKAADALVEWLLLRALGVHENRLHASRDRLQELLVRLLEDRDVLRTKGTATRAARSPAAQAADMRALVEEFENLRTFQQTVREAIGGGEHDWHTALRNHMETQLGLTRSYTPVLPPKAAEIARLLPLVSPPRLAPGTHPAIEGAARSLLQAMENHPPRPVRPVPKGRKGPYESYSARQYAGAQSKRVNDAARTLVALFRGRGGNAVTEAVKAIIGGSGDLAERNRMVIAVLVAHKRIVPGKAVPKGGPQVKAGAFQQRWTGSSFEWTGRLRQPIRGFTTIGIDGIVEGWVLDAKYSEAPLAESGHIKGRVIPPKKGKVSDEIQRGLPRRDRPWEVDETPDVATQMKPSPPVSAREQIAVYEEKTGITVETELERQLAFAHENGLRGVHWVTNSPELAAAFEEILGPKLRKPGVELQFKVVSER
ncbi:hypothetical protein [Streptomyces sp. NRRL S-337]|uniref:hypothetical protein n=1 Tax=Streptomyces sp. NRRL S-337 TaxID=1463900 RepID=UPI0004CAE3FB|nr:hypothetical protein [Streptomyces sp. NRRL S-337]